MSTKNRQLRQVSRRIRKVREQSGYNKAEFARILGIDQASYWRYEKGEVPPNLKLLIALARETDTNINWLITGRDPIKEKFPKRLKKLWEVPEVKKLLIGLERMSPKDRRKLLAALQVLFRE